MLIKTHTHTHTHTYTHTSQEGLYTRNDKTTWPIFDSKHGLGECHTACHIYTLVHPLTHSTVILKQKEKNHCLISNHRNAHSYLWHILPTCGQTWYLTSRQCVLMSCDVMPHLRTAKGSKSVTQ